MRERNNINAKVHQSGLLTERQNDKAGVKQSELPLGEVAAARAKRREAVTFDRNAVVAKWLDAALSAHPKAGSIAADCGISDAYLSQMRTGERTVPAHLFLSLLDYQPSALALVGAMAAEAGLAAPQPLKTELTPQQKREARRMFISEIRAVSLLHSAAVQRVAEYMGVDACQVDEIFDEPTGEHHIGVAR